MAKKKVVELQKKSRLDALKIMRGSEGFPGAAAQSDGAGSQSH